MANDSLEDRVFRLEGKVQEMEVNLGVFCDVVERAVASQEKLNTTIDTFNGTVTDLKFTMITMQNEIKNSGEKVSSLEGNIANIRTDIGKEITDVKKSVREMDEKGKILIVTGKQIGRAHV